MAVGKLWDLEQKRLPGTDRPFYDLIVVDTPATGHVVSYLQMPMTAAETAKGFVRREARKVADLLQDPLRTSFHIVTTPAEMPANEALDLYEKARSRLHLPIGCLFVNQVYPPFFQGTDGESYRRWRGELKGRPEGEPASRSKQEQNEEIILACAESWKRARAAQDAHLGRLFNVFGDRTTLLPFITAPHASIDMIRTLARSIENPDETMKGGASGESGS